MNEIIRETVEERNVSSEVESFEFRQRKAQLYAQSKIIPTHFQKNVADCYIIVTMAEQLNVPEMICFQHAYVIKGKVSWSAVFLIACFNSCGRFSPIEYEFDQTANDKSCRAFATCKQTGRTKVGPIVSLSMADKMKWGDQWKKMPELMLRYRAAAFLVKTVAPEIALGLSETSELKDEFVSNRGGFQDLAIVKTSEGQINLAATMDDIEEEFSKLEPDVATQESNLPPVDTQKKRGPIEGDG